ncbi:MAG: glucose-6-phosphate dehydrogenase assembly protein OpcA [Ktedonobacteraceae bacterium]|nr:glucose-6-phosphate dehydrogenase assembly protein OpcA [Ktedonobacteraceae bacterium]
MGIVKDNTEDTGPRLPWAGKRVRPENVEEELSRFWCLAADNMRISQNIRVRTSVLNFIICAPDIASAQRASQLLRDLSSTNLARVFLVILDTDDQTSSISTWVTLRSFPIVSDIMRHHFEQITLLASGAQADDIPYLIRSLLKPDLPVYLWWLSDLPASDTALNRLIAFSDRVIVDSHKFLRLEESFRTLSALMQTCPDCAISDLSWGRITPWRELVAQFFDVPEYRSYLQGVNAIEVEHAVPALDGSLLSQQDETTHSPTQALLLATWLKTLLGWQFSRGNTLEEHDPATGIYAWHMARTGQLGRTRQPTRTATVLNTGGEIALRPRIQPNLRPGSICMVRLSSLWDGKSAVFTINRADNDTEHVLTSVELDEGPRPTRLINLPAMLPESELLHNELEITGHDDIYEEVLQEVFSLLAEES